MNRSNFVQTGGFPLKTERLQEMQDAYSIFNSLGLIAGNLTILKGCETVGGNVQEGVVVIEGEVLEFRQAFYTEDANVIILEETAEKPFKNGQLKNIHYKRYATFGTADSSWAWSEFVRPIQTKDLPSNLLERLTALEKKTAVFQNGGGMVLWNKPANLIPEGWQEVTDWKGRIPVGLDAAQSEFNVLGKTGGSKTQTLTVGNIPNHKHQMFVDGNNGNLNNKATPTSGANVTGQSGGDRDYQIGKAADGATPTLGQTSGTGTGNAFPILNPYRVVIFIEYIG
ncbi:MAG: hypothetical protein JNM71_12835 [Flavobacterium lindanitolerans]|uniref:phage baseplate protein n=1 Tax=Flavobacterium lindanitolerans TaxID=428988 RepID=UPI001A5FBD5E|nr:hypothetical protein [Flavobacterium lindanitolerans]MBL7868893.1 hypothetical protein [Flavobacterium lindanitolerans]